MNESETIEHGRFAELDGRTVFALARLRQAVFVVEQECAYPDLDDRDVDPETVHFWVEEGADGNAAARPEGRAVACLRVLRDGGGWVIGRVCCAKERRGTGLSARLMAAAMAWLGPESDVRLGAQTYAAGFYRRFGFVEDGEEYLEDDIPHVPMRRPGTRSPR
ncbi:GNAT family N-acetyltransferase [Glycomyces sp. TRM65418]|uniref:GNAT family N-acetyltransferase n=1 Tax=Glycomyces sp. TRM65418 TaxID=2867006 RepID=UPI001CE5505C|nr:GNAT family N-acetyltransferase [Glycomyces sp. TRM65418]MCC3765438.1 GNAT family N-acetyltransferase [Glycomyces sp. TRM65418]QZD55048.1 GNAT family N-acetyltransferase [Glycomyces sp. TRM65418]